MKNQANLRALILAAAMFFITPAIAQPIQTVQTAAGTITVTNLASGLSHPWGMAFLPDKRLLVTERSGKLRLLSADNTLSEPLAGTPEVFNQGQGGLLDVAIDPNFEANHLIYLSFAEPGKGGTSTALGRGHLEEGRITDFKVIFRQQPKVTGSNHFGGRIVFSLTDTLFLTLGERFKFEPAQDLSNHLGAIVHIYPDGSIPRDNPFTNQAEARDEIWTYGHRNIQAAAIQPGTGALWIAEMGPRGGDELNLIEAGRNYGWPIVSWGQHYDGEDIPDPPTHPHFASAHLHWTPVISPSGMEFYTGEMFPEWQGSALIGGLTAQGIIRIAFKGMEVIGEEERIPLGARIRDIKQAPDGSVYVLTDQRNGNVWRLSAATE
jgi:aldose sugar dehydrogenase